MQFLLNSTSHYIGLGLDVAVVAVLVIFACIGYHKGLLRSLLALCSTALVIVVAVYFANGFAKLINSAFDFTSLIAKKLSPSIKGLGAVFQMTFPSGLSGKEFYNNYISSTNINVLLKKFFKFALRGYSSSQIEGVLVADVLAGAVASILMTIISGILLFILIKIALALLTRLFDNITKARVLGGLNKIAGFLFGALEGATFVLTFVCITIGVTFVPSLNKKLYPLIQDNTKVVKLIYNKTDEQINKRVIKKDLISKWIDNLWDSRYLRKDKEVDTIADLALVIDSDEFVENEGVYTATYNGNVTSTESYLRVNKFIPSKEYANITITLTYSGGDIINGDMYLVKNLDDKLTKDVSGNTTKFIYQNIDYDDFVLALKSSGSDISVIIKIEIE